MEIYDENNRDTPRTTWNSQPKVDVSAAHVQDYFINFLFQVPLTFPSGMYTMRSLRRGLDRRSGGHKHVSESRIAQRTLDFRVGGPVARSWPIPAPRRLPVNCPYRAANEPRFLILMRSDDNPHPCCWRSCAWPVDIFNLTGKVALVTGGSKGLGKAMARGLAEAGADIVISSRHESELRPALDEILKGTGRRGRFSSPTWASATQVEQPGQHRPGADGPRGHPHQQRRHQQAASHRRDHR